MKCWSLLFALFLPATAHALAQDVLVRFDTAANRNAAFAALTAEGATPVSVHTFDSGAEQWRMSLNWHPVESKARILAQPGCLYADNDVHYYPQAVPNDSLLARQWYLDCENSSELCGGDISATGAWDVTTGDTSIVVGLIDTGGTGIFMEGQQGTSWHEDLQQNAWINYGEIPANGIDDDLNGKIDDRWGWSFAGNEELAPEQESNSPSGFFNHGIRMSGIIGATTNNGRGIAGIAWHCRIMHVKWTMGPVGNTFPRGWASAAIKAIDYARRMNVDIMVCAFNGHQRVDALRDALIQAANAGIVIVATAGNGALDGSVNGPGVRLEKWFWEEWPACYHDIPGMIVVGATDDGSAPPGIERAFYSNYGEEEVDLFAPGRRMFTTLDNSAYFMSYGASFASAVVAGVAVLVKSINPTFTPEQIKQRIMDTVDWSPYLNGLCVTGGMVNAHRAVAPSIGGSVESLPAPITAAPIPEPAVAPKHYDVQGRQIDPSIQRSGVTFTRKPAGTTKRATVK